MDPKLQAFINSLPKFADELYCSAEGEARNLLRGDAPNPLTRLARGIAAALPGGSAKERLLAYCIFDLHLTSFFAAFMEHLGDVDSASALVDALLYQATGSEAGSPTEEELLDSVTQNVRGIQKFQAARKSMPHISDIEAWIFAREFSAIVSGEPKDISNIVSVSPFSLIARVRSRWHIRYLLYGVLPTEEEKQALEDAVRNRLEGTQDMIDGWKKFP
jgi:hypothetical protein